MRGGCSAWRTASLVSIGVLAGGFLVAAVSTAVLLPSDRSPALPAAVVLVLAYAAAFRLDFEIGTGSAVPTELIFVPMLFVLPIGLVPLAVAAGTVLGSLHECLRGQLRFARVPVRIVNAWYSLGRCWSSASPGNARRSSRTGRSTSSP